MVMVNEAPPVTRIRTIPPSMRCATPCVTAFSTSGCSSSGGTRHASKPRLAVASTLEPLAEADLLDREKSRGQRDLARQRDPLPRTQRQRVAQKVREQQAHPPRRRGVDRGQRADRMQAVEEKMRIDLRAQRAKLGFARQDLQLEPPPLGIARGFERARHVAHRHRQQVEEKPEREQRRRRAPESDRDVSPWPERGEDTEPAARGEQPQCARHERGGARGGDHEERFGTFDRESAARVPRRQAQKPYTTESGSAKLIATLEGNTPCSARSAASRRPSGSQIAT